MSETAKPKKKQPSGQQNRRRRAEKGGPLYTEADLARQKRRRIRKYWQRRALLDAIKLGSGCVDCGYRTHPAALEFDHLPGVEKRGDLAWMAASNFSWAVVLEEAEKCEVVCANCHAIRTQERKAERGFYHTPETLGKLREAWARRKAAQQEPPCPSP